MWASVRTDSTSKPTPGFEPGTPSLRETDRRGKGGHKRTREITIVLQSRGFEVRGGVRACPFGMGLMYPSRTLAVSSAKATKEGTT
jgi:hypothetical protein